MARLTAAQRRALPKSDFAVPSKAPGPGSYPIPDAAHARAAKSLGARFAGKSLPQVNAKANKKLNKKPTIQSKKPSYIG